MYAGLMFFTAALFQALRGITGSSAFAWLSPNDALEQLGDVIFRLDPRYDLLADGGGARPWSRSSPPPGSSWPVA